MCKQRTSCMVQQIARGVDGRVKMRRKDVLAWQVTEDVAVQPVSVRQGYIYPPEFQLICNILISNKDRS